MKITKFKGFAIVLLSLLITSCSTTTIEKAVPPPEKVTYQVKVKPIIDANCTKTCHSPGKTASFLDLSTYAAFRLGTEIKPVIARMKNVATPMPPAGFDLVSDANIAIIEKWVADGYLEN